MIPIPLIESVRLKREVEEFKFKLSFYVGYLLAQFIARFIAKFITTSKSKS